MAAPVATPFDELINRLVSACEPAQILLFGSRARGDERPDSDYDLLVVLDRIDDHRSLELAITRATRDLPIEADVVFTTPAEIATRGHLAGTALRPALRDARVVYRRYPVDNAQAAREWLTYADEDARAARALLADESVAPRHACYYAQQMAEKALKAALTFVDIDPPKSHNLDALRNTLPPGWAVQRQFPSLDELTIWNAAGRYPGDWPEASAAEAATMIELGESILHSIRDELVARGMVAQ
jgi:HEPN domain-containing protein/predicted nucleotidyltransferase